MWQILTSQLWWADKTFLFVGGQRATEQILFIIGTSVYYVTQGVADFQSMNETVYGSCKMYMMPTFKFTKVWMKP